MNFRKTVFQHNKWILTSLFFMSLVSCDNFDGFLDTEEVNTIIDDNGVISEADVIFGIFPDSEFLFYSIVDQNELVLIQDKDEDGSIDGYYIERDEENVFIEIDDKINLPIGASTSTGEVLFFDYNIDFTLVNVTLVDQNGVTETKENIPVNTIFGESSKEQINLKQFKNDDEDLNEAADRLVKGVEGTLAAVACLSALVSPPPFTLISLLGCGGAILSISGAFDDIKIKEQNKPRVTPNSLNTIKRENLSLATNIVKCSLETFTNNPFSCAELVINETNTVKEAKRELAKEFLKRFDEYFGLEIFRQREYTGDISFTYIPGPAGDNCTCGQGTASVTIDFGNGLTKTLSIGARERIVLERGNYNITLNYSWGAVRTTNLNVSEYLWQLGATCTCINIGPQGD